MNRMQEVRVAEGTFRILLTPQQRLMAVVDAPTTLLGPLHIALEVDRGIHPDVLRRHALAQRGMHPQYIQVGGIFSDIGKFVGKAAEGAFNAASKSLTTVARPVFKVTNQAASHVMQGIAKVTPFLPAKARNQISSAARIVARARLGDVNAKQFMKTIAQAAKAGVTSARRIGDALLDGSKLVAKIIDLPMHVLKNVPGVGKVVTAISPFAKYDRMASAIQRGDFKALKDMVQGDLQMAQGIISLIPGIGTGISAGISAGLAVLDGGGLLDIAIRTAYGAIPIPIGVRHLTDAVLAAILQLIKGGKITDVLVAAARDKIPSGLPRDVFDTLVRIVVKRMPIVKAAGALASHYVSQYTGQAGTALLGQLGKAIDPKLAAMARIALPIGAAKPTAAGRPLFRPMTVAGEEPVAYDVSGEDEPLYDVAGEEPIAGYDVAGEDPEGYAVSGDEPTASYEIAGEGDDELVVAGEDPYTELLVAGEEPVLGYDVAGEDEEIFVGAEFPPELLADFGRTNEWRSTRSARA